MTKQDFTETIVIWPQQQRKNQQQPAVFSSQASSAFCCTVQSNFWVMDRYSSGASLRLDSQVLCYVLW